MADPVGLVVLALVGLVGGTVGALFGVGGGIVAVPLVLFVLPGTAFHEAKAASLLMVVAAASVGMLAHRRRKSVDLRRGAALGLSGVLGAWLGVHSAERVADATLQIAFGILLVIVGIRLALDVRPRARQVPFPVEVAALAALGLVAGLLSGLFGIGGGVAMVPGLVALGLGIHLAVGTSLAAVAVNALAGTATHAAVGYGPVLLGIGVPLAVGAIAGAEAGAHLAHRLPAAKLQRAFGLFLAAVGVYLAVSAGP